MKINIYLSIDGPNDLESLVYHPPDMAYIPRMGETLRWSNYYWLLNDWFTVKNLWYDMSVSEVIIVLESINLQLATHKAYREMVNYFITEGWELR